MARAKAKVKAKAKAFPTSLTDPQPRRSPRLAAALCRIAMLVALVARGQNFAAEAPIWVPVDGNIVKLSSHRRVVVKVYLWIVGQSE